MKHYSFSATALIFLLTILNYSTSMNTMAYADITPNTAPEKGLNVRIEYNVSHSYRIGPGDVLSLNVYPQEEFSHNDILVRSDGMATFPKVGDLMVSGKTVDDINQELKEKLSQWIKNATVTLSIASTRPAIFYLSGSVKKAGPFEMVTNAHDSSYTINNENYGRRADLVLTNVLANAGGVKLNADLSQIQIKHKDTNQIVTVNLWKVLKEGVSDEDLWLNPGDSIYVPELSHGRMMSDEDFQTLLNSVIAPKTFPVRVIGQVQTPNLVKLEGETPLLSTAIAMAGGFSPQALKKVVAIKRFTDDNHFTTLFINVEKNDFVLRPNDVVYVAESKLYQTGRFMQQVSLILGPIRDVATTGAMGAQVFGFGGWNTQKKF